MLNKRFKNYEDEGIARANFWARKGVPREPLKTVAEMAEELGVSSKSLGKLLSSRDGPKPCLMHQGLRKVSYYRPSDVRKWFQERCK